MRRILPQVACAWLACYVLGMATPVALWAWAPVTAEADDCNCGHAAGVMCPMHKTTKGRSGCALRNGTHQDPLTLVSLLAPVGPIRSASSLQPPRPSALVTTPERLLIIERALTPESPPPRA